MTPEPIMSRRKFLIGAGVLTGVGIFAYSGLRLIRYSYYRLGPKLLENVPAGRLSDSEMKTMLALVEVLVPGSTLPDPKERIRIINTRTEKNGSIFYEYKAACILLDKTTKKMENIAGFHDASMDQREKILRSVLWSYEGGGSKSHSHYIADLYASLERIFKSESERRFRSYVVKDLLTGIYTEESVAYQLADYTHWPGYPARDLRDYTQPIDTELWRGHVKKFDKS